jgi:U6 snRNA-associated Sm-like protein LSm4
LPPYKRRAQANQYKLVELKNGVTFNGHLVECDNFMNVTLREVYQTSADGEKFWKMKEMYIKGNVVSLLASIDDKY